MKILAIRTDKPLAELNLYEDNAELELFSWQAHRQLGETIHLQMRDLLKRHEMEFKDLGGLVLFKGPGSFTGLRIGASVANTFADGLEIPIVGAIGDNWQRDGIMRIMNKENDGSVMPEYGAEPHITQQRK
jgi:tRNA threonylcarbamoyladenosine biosynthesis protein TsaB